MLTPSGEAERQVVHSWLHLVKAERGFDGQNDRDADREAELSDRRKSVGDYIYAGTRRRKKKKFWMKERV